MSKRYDKALTVEELAKASDRDIDFSDIPELDETFWQNARLIEPDRAQSVTIRVKKSVLDYFKAGGRGYQTRINAVLEAYVRAKRTAPTNNALLDLPLHQIKMVSLHPTLFPHQSFCCQELVAFSRGLPTF